VCFNCNKPGHFVFYCTEELTAGGIKTLNDMRKKRRERGVKGKESEQKEKSKKKKEYQIFTLAFIAPLSPKEKESLALCSEIPAQSDQLPTAVKVSTEVLQVNSDLRKTQSIHSL
jgi:hypothetical protein